MANSSITIYSSGGSPFYLSLDWNEASASTENNTSTINLSGTLSSTYGAFEVSNAGTMYLYWYDNNNYSGGTLVASLLVERCGYDPYGSKTITGSITVPHKSNGELSGYGLLTWTRTRDAYAIYIPESGTTQTEWQNLTQIAVRPTLSILNTANMYANNFSVNYTLGNTGNRSTNIQYSVDGSNWNTFDTKNYNDTFITTITTNLLPNYPDTPNPVVYFRATNSGGTTDAIAYTATIAPSIVPTVSSVSISPVNSISQLSGLYVQGISKVRVQTNANGIQGSTIASVFSGIFYNDPPGGAYSKKSSDWTSDILPNYGTIYASSYATDSRGRDSSKKNSSTATVIQYYNPTISNVTYQRCNSNGTLYALGKYIKLSFSYNVARIRSGTRSYNEFNLYYSFDNQVWTPITASQYQGTISNLVIGGNLPLKQRQKLYIKVTDLANETINESDIHTVTEDLSNYVDLTIDTRTKFTRESQIGDTVVANFNGDVYTGYFDASETISNEITVKYYVYNEETEQWLPIMVQH